MTFNFDTPPDRRGTDSQKWQKYAGRDVLPMWVADMDFEAAPAIVEALQRRVGPRHLRLRAPGQVDRRGRGRRPGRPVRLEGRPLLDRLAPGPRLRAERRGPRLRRGRATRSSASRRSIRPSRWRPKHAGAGRRAASPSPWTPPPGAGRSTGTPSRRPSRRGRGPSSSATRTTRSPGSGAARSSCASPTSAPRHDLVLCSDDIHCDLLLEKGAVHEPVAVVARQVAAPAP